MQFGSVAVNYSQNEEKLAALSAIVSLICVLFLDFEHTKHDLGVVALSPVDFGVGGSSVANISVEMVGIGESQSSLLVSCKSSHCLAYAYELS